MSLSTLSHVTADVVTFPLRLAGSSPFFHHHHHHSPLKLSIIPMAFAPKSGCPMCGIVATASHAPPNSPRSPSFPPGSKQPEVLWRDDNFTAYREKANPVSSSGHIIVAFKCVSTTPIQRYFSFVRTAIACMSLPYILSYDVSCDLFLSFPDASLVLKRPTPPSERSKFSQSTTFQLASSFVAKCLPCYPKHRYHDHIDSYTTRRTATAKATISHRLHHTPV